MDRYIGQTVLCVGNIHQTIVDCSVLEASREYQKIHKITAQEFNIKGYTLFHINIGIGIGIGIATCIGIGIATGICIAITIAIAIAIGMADDK